MPDIITASKRELMSDESMKLITPQGSARRLHKLSVSALWEVMKISTLSWHSKNSHDFFVYMVLNPPQPGGFSFVPCCSVNLPFDERRGEPDQAY